MVASFCEKEVPSSRELLRGEAVVSERPTCGGRLSQSTDGRKRGFFFSICGNIDIRARASVLASILSASCPIMHEACPLTRGMRIAGAQAEYLVACSCVWIEKRSTKINIARASEEKKSKLVFTSSGERGARHRRGRV